MKIVSSVHRAVPVMDEITHGFWEMAQRKILGVQRCRACGRAQHPPAPDCTYCGSESLEFTAASGFAHLVTWTEVVHAFVSAWTPDLPFTAFLVELDDWPGLLMPSDDIYFLRRRGTSLPQRVNIAMSVQFEPLAGSDLLLPQFVPRGTST